MRLDENLVTPKRGLGKGLDALLPITETAPAAGGMAVAPLAAIARNAHQPRTTRPE